MPERPPFEDRSRPKTWADASDPARSLWRLWLQGETPDVKLFLEHAAVTDPEMIVAVLRVDQRERALRGERLSAEHYLRAFPAVSGDDEAAVDLVFAEYLLREELSEHPTLDEFVRRFPEHADAIRLQIELHEAVEGPDAATLHAPPDELDSLEMSVTAFRDPRDTYPTIAGYEVLGVLGRGGMGVVYRAWQIDLKRLVALKMLLAGAHSPPGLLERFHNEVEAIARLQHPGIVQIHGVGEVDGLPYCALELVDGGTLSDKLDGTPLPSAEAAAMAVQLARAIHVAHAKGIVHRDLKPGNVLLTAEGTPKITDFGLAKVLTGGESNTRTGDIMGTPSYMSPEQAEGRSHAVGAASDVYSLGAILYEMLAGRPPFRAATPADTIRQVVMDDPVPLSRIQPGLPRDLETICLKCLEKDPRRRYDSALALAEDLQAWIDGMPIRARRSSLIEHVVKWTRRRPTVAALLLAVVLVTAVGFTGVVVQWRRTEAARRKAAENAVAEKAMRRKADGALAKAEATLYLNRISLAAQMWTANNTRAANQLLDRCRPDQRRWEWHYLKRLAHGGDRWLRDLGGLLCFARSPDGRQLAAGGWWRTIRIWDAQSGAELFSLDGHSGEILGLAYHPNGTILASGSADRTIRLWDVPTGKTVRTWQAHEGEVRGVMFSPDGRYLASAGDDGRACVWDAETGRLERTLDARAHGARAVAFSPDGRWLATAHDDRIAIIWDWKTGNRRHTLAGHRVDVRAVTFSADGQKLATGAIDSTARVWDLASGKELRTCVGHRNAVNSVAFSADGRTLATASSDRTIGLWDLSVPDAPPQILRGHEESVAGVLLEPDGRHLLSVSEDRTIRSWPLPPAVNSQILRCETSGMNAVQFSPDGQSLASGGPNGSVRIWDAATGAHRRDIPGFHANVSAVAFSRDSLRLAASSEDRTDRVWDFLSGRELAHFDRFTQDLRRMSISADGRLVASTNANAVYVWNTADGTLRFSHTFSGPAQEALFSPDGRLLAVSGGEQGQNLDVVLIDVATRAAVRTFPNAGPPINRMAFSVDQRMIATARLDKTILIWELASGRLLRTLNGHNDWIFGLAFSPDGSRLAAGGMGWTTKMWDLATGDETLTLEGHREPVYGVAFSTDGRKLATASNEGTVRVWDATPLAEGWSEGWLLDEGPTALGGALFSPDGLTLATAKDTGAIQLWDAKSGWATDALTGHERPVRSMVFSPSGRLLATAAERPDGRGQVKVWDFGSRSERVELPIDKAGVQVVAFVGHGERLVTLTGEGFAVWDEDGRRVTQTFRQPPTTSEGRARPHVGAVSPDGQIFAAATSRNAIHVWDARGHSDFELEARSVDLVTALEFSADGRRLLAGRWSSGIRVWDTTQWKPLGRLKPTAQTHGLSLATDGRTLAVGQDVGIVELWDVPTETRIGQFYGYGAEFIGRVHFSPDCRTVASAARNGSVVLWAINPLKLRGEVRAEGVAAHPAR
jgi:WD40 repeat protein